jgi:protein-S-isoprenylcysteine O-methyltransferase Ste14
MTEHSNQTSEDMDIKRGIINWAVKGILYKAYVAVILMVSAGRWDWGAGWLYVFIFLMFDLATALAVIPKDPTLLIERSKSHSDVKTWDKVIMPLASGLLPLIGWILAGLNLRWNWLPPVSWPWQLIGFLLTVAGYGLVVWAMGANAFFSPLVRIQQDRGHQVADQGPYKIIRHPGYFGATLFTLGVPILLGSWWATIPNLVAVILYVIRTYLEDQVLAEELPGYDEYKDRVKYRLVPRVW